MITSGLFLFQCHFSVLGTLFLGLVSARVSRHGVDLSWSESCPPAEIIGYLIMVDSEIVRVTFLFFIIDS